jgi:NTP pyrophosphatase (non-canonical NTP hydrolase)
MSSLQEEILQWHLEHFQCFPEAALRKAAVEMGELIQADFDLEYADREGLPHDGHRAAVARELGDVLICLYAYAGRRGIDLDAAARDKWAEVKGRSPERIHRKEGR